MSINKVSTNSSINWATTETAGRVAPDEGPTFREVLDSGAQSLVAGATAAVRSLPMGPIVAASVRPGAGLGMATGAADLSGATLAPASGATAEGPGANASASASASAHGEPNMESALERSEELNMYMLELQTRVAEQNRAFTTYSNVLKARHDTLKGVINNIR